MIEIRGLAAHLTGDGLAPREGFSDELIRVTPTRIVAFGIDAGSGEFNSRDVATAEQPE